MAIVCKSASEIEKMRRSGSIVRQVLNHVRSLVVPGATTMDLERAAEQQIKELGVKPAFKGYYGVPGNSVAGISSQPSQAAASRGASATWYYRAEPTKQQRASHGSQFWRFVHRATQREILPWQQSLLPLLASFPKWLEPHCVSGSYRRWHVLESSASSLMTRSGP